MENQSSNETLHTSNELERLSSEIQELESPADKLRKTIELMEFSISQKGQPDFKVFWNARESCLSLFKEDIPPPIRSGYWQKYRELTQQARLLKEHFEEESSFALEQIEKAIDAIENEMKDLQLHVNEAEINDFPKLSAAVQSNRNQYMDFQKELNFLNAYASRVNALRKEVVNTKMRMRKKNRFFERLSELGNKVFPRRKELIEALSNLFTSDIDLYVKQRFSNLSVERSPHVYREEIKALQAAAKMLSLNGKAFSQTRQKLSECWDKLKEIDKQRKKEYDEKKETFVKNAEDIRQKIQAYKEEFAVDDFSVAEAQRKIDEIFKEMKNVELGRDEVNQLRTELSEAKQPLMDKLKEEEKKRRQLQLEKEEERQSAIKDVEDGISNLLKLQEEKVAEELIEEILTLKDKIETLQLAEQEKDSMLRSLVLVEDVAYQKQDNEEDLPNDPDALKDVLQKRLRFKLDRRNLIKGNLEGLRKACGSSGLDFEQSLYNNQQLTIEKERLENISEEIRSLEKRISKL